MPKFIDRTGLRYSKLVVISHMGGRRWLCRCDCGNEVAVSGGNLTTGNSTNCGCVRREGLIKRNFRHGMVHTPELLAWKQMIRRCDNPNNKNYGGRGITVCQEWRDDFWSFYNFIGPRPSPKYSIDRYPNNNGNYEPGNVRWATQKEQVANSRDRGPACSIALKKVHAERPRFNRRQSDARKAAQQTEADSVHRF